MSIESKQQALIDEFADMEDWQERYHYLVDLGKELDALPESEHLDELKVSGCVSQVWLRAVYTDEKLQFRADSDSIFVKGLIALLLEVYSGETPQAIFSADGEFLKVMGITENLSPNRANGLGSMLQTIKNYAEKYA